MDLYHIVDSPPCWSVRITAAALNVKLNLKEMDLLEKKNHLSPEFTKLNPQQTVPTLVVEKDFIMAESRATIAYLADKYGKDDSLYPKDLKTRAIVNQRLFFDIGTLYDKILYYYFAKFFNKQPDPQDLKRFEKALGVLNTFLEGNNYVAGTKTFTIADISLYSSLKCVTVFNFDFSPYPNVKKWLKLMDEKAPAKEVITEGLKELKALLETYNA
ncbi:CLUMA_CG020093, isoform A [Clunio marinus]|uniref:glutathione transferase n=1 Tax=Clunio marinus TaxID=568069 RepID=A0A1J1J555_9DIPT|nr:CLUMA_CG020089, isoform A [Clunio marinus]CRL07094.1 CLUMA_CG020093, isoform A [Clunio marinus]